VASGATRDEHGHFVHVSDKARKEMSEAGKYYASHLPRDEHVRWWGREGQDVEEEAAAGKVARRSRPPPATTVPHAPAAGPPHA
jgi:hypothetical protein